MLRNLLLALLAFGSVTFAASVNYSASVSCNADGSAPTIMSGSTLSQGLYLGCSFTTGTAGIAEVLSGPTGPTQDVTPIAYSLAGTTTPNYVVTMTSISDPNMSIIDTGLPSGTPLNVQETWSAAGGLEYQFGGTYQNPIGTAGIGGYLQVSVDGLGPTTAYIQTPGCAYGSSLCSLGYSDRGVQLLNVTSSFQTTVGADFSSNVSLYATAEASGGAQANITFYNYRLISSPVQLSNLTVTNANTGQVISSAVLEGSSGAYGIVAPVPEIDASSAPSAFALIAAVLFIYRGRLSYGSMSRS